MIFYKKVTFFFFIFPQQQGYGILQGYHIFFFHSWYFKPDMDASTLKLDKIPINHSSRYYILFYTQDIFMIFGGSLSYGNKIDTEKQV